MYLRATRNRLGCNNSTKFWKKMKSSAIVKVEKHVSKQVEKLVKRSKEIFGKVVKTRQKLESEQRNFSVFESHFGV